MYLMNYAPVAQLDRVGGFEPLGREFESLRVRHFFTYLALQTLRTCDSSGSYEEHWTNSYPARKKPMSEKIPSGFQMHLPNKMYVNFNQTFCYFSLLPMCQPIR